MKKMRDLTGMTFGRWQVQDQFRCRAGSREWLCRCSCEKKTEKYVNERNLLRGKSQSCGCLIREVSKRKYKDLTGRQFGALKVISRAENKNDRAAWNCECRCGKSCVKSSHQLLVDHVKSCGCRIDSKGKNMRDLKNMNFGHLEALFPTEERDYKGSVMWRCRCKKCGGEKSISEDSLVHGRYKSCGCDQYSFAENLLEQRHFYNGTCVEALDRKVRSDNKTGVRGVSITRNGTYRATIGFQGKQYHLGTYKSMREAEEARARAWSEVHGRFLRAYAAWSKDREQGRLQRELIFEIQYVNGEFFVHSNYLPGETPKPEEQKYAVCLSGNRGKIA